MTSVEVGRVPFASSLAAPYLFHEQLSCLTSFFFLLLKEFYLKFRLVKLLSSGRLLSDGNWVLLLICKPQQWWVSYSSPRGSVRVCEHSTARSAGSESSFVGTQGSFLGSAHFDPDEHHTCICSCVTTVQCRLKTPIVGGRFRVWGRLLSPLSTLAE